MNAVTNADWRRETIALCTQAVEMLRHTRQGFASQQLDAIDAAERVGRLLHRDERTLTDRLVHPYPSARVVLEADRRRLFVPVHLDRIADHIDLLLRSLRTAVRDGVPFTDRARREIAELIDGATELLLDLRDLLMTHNKVLRQHVIDSGKALVARADDFAAFHEQRLIEGVCAPKASALYLAAIDALKGIEWHSREIAQKLGRLTPDDVRDLDAVVAASEPGRPGPRGESSGESRPFPAPVGWVP